jgi:formylglycine-generating enzyme required for sulfatase activity
MEKADILEAPMSGVLESPTEAEWEYACRAWTSTRLTYGDDPGYMQLTNYAWYGENSDWTTHPVGQKLPNVWGLYDMCGNVWEWCQDWWVGNLPGGTVLDPEGPATGSARVMRSASYVSFPYECRSAYRWYCYPNNHAGGIGFRVVLARGQP